MELDQVDARPPSECLWNISSEIDEDQRAICGGPDTERVRRSHRFFLGDQFTDVARAVEQLDALPSRAAGTALRSVTSVAPSGRTRAAGGTDGSPLQLHEVDFVDLPAEPE